MKTDADCLAKTALYAFPAVLALVVVCVQFLDQPVALEIARVIRSNDLLSRHTANLPDVLPPGVLLFSAGAWAAYLRRTRDAIHDERTAFYRLAGTALPAVFFLKAAMKFAFGRINTRSWIEQPAAHTFLWFRGVDDHTAFPSGHMAVFAALAAAFWIFFPRTRTPGLVFLSLLGAALVVTDYHFVSDVVAGGYLGLAVAAVACRILEGRPVARG
jgi:membrane-associated phospholipid phosphatase